MAALAARAKSLFLAASDLADPAERAAYLGRECGGDAELRDRVEALLRANDAAPLPPAPEATSAHTSDRQPPTEDYGDPTACVGAFLAGKYKLIEKIGEGGMGSVYMAQQTEPVKRAVAVKCQGRRDRFAFQPFVYRQTKGPANLTFQCGSVGSVARCFLTNLIKRVRNIPAAVTLWFHDPHGGTVRFKACVV
jgi:hypothetical protein